MIANLYGGFLKPERYAGDLCLDAGGGVQSIICTPDVQLGLVAPKHQTPDTSTTLPSPQSSFIHTHESLPQKQFLACRSSLLRRLPENLSLIHI